MKELFEVYKGYKEIRSIEAKHHEDRPRDMIEEGLKFVGEMEKPKTVRYYLMSGRKGITMSLRGRTQM